MNREQVEKFLVDAGWQLEGKDYYLKRVDGRQYRIQLLKTVCKVKVQSLNGLRWYKIGGTMFRDCKIIPPAQGHKLPILTIGTIKIIGASL